MKQDTPTPILRNIMCTVLICERRGGAEKITTPSDLCLHSQALSVNAGNPCESPSPKPRRTSTCETLADLCHHTEVLHLISTPCGVSTKTQTREFQLNLSGSDSIVANRAGVILPYDFFLSTKKCDNDRIFL